jgi:hypothetical protein
VPACGNTLLRERPEAFEELNYQELKRRANVQLRRVFLRLATDGGKAVSVPPSGGMDGRETHYRIRWLAPNPPLVRTWADAQRFCSSSDSTGKVRTGHASSVALFQ